MPVQDPSVVADMHEIIGVDRVAAHGLHVLVRVAQHEQDARLVALDHSVDARRCAFDVGVVAMIADQIHAELIEAEVGDADAAVHIFKIEYLVLHLPELTFPVLQISLLVGIDVVIVAGGSHHSDLHACLDSVFELEIFVEIHVGPVVDQLDTFVRRADTIDAAKTLDDTHRIPMDVVVDHHVAVLQILPFGDTIRGDQNVDVCVFQPGHSYIAFL